MPNAGIPNGDGALAWVETLMDIFGSLRNELLEIMRKSRIEDMSHVVEESPDDTIYSLDLRAEEILKPLLKEKVPALGGAIVVAEGMDTLRIESTDGSVPSYRVLIDPIDGTRELMYGKRSAWAVAAVALDKGDKTRLSESVASVMVELPTPRAALADYLWAVKGEGARCVTVNLNDGERSIGVPSPSRAENLEDGFAMISRFFPGGKDIIAAIEEEMMLEVVGSPVRGRATVFEDQYICTAGQWVELIQGRDRFCADIRKAVYALNERTRGHEPGHCVRPHDAAGLLVAREAGVIITDLEGSPLDAPFDTLTDLDWVGYANEKLRDKIEGPLRKALEKFGVL